MQRGARRRRYEDGAEPLDAGLLSGGGHRRRDEREAACDHLVEAALVEGGVGAEPAGRGAAQARADHQVGAAQGRCLGVEDVLLEPGHAVQVRGDDAAEQVAEPSPAVMAVPTSFAVRIRARTWGLRSIS